MSRWQLLRQDAPQQWKVGYQPLAFWMTGAIRRDHRYQVSCSRA